MITEKHVLIFVGIIFSVLCASGVFLRWLEVKSCGL